MQIWVDADACPGVVKDILFRAADRAGIKLTLVANSRLRTPASRWIHTLQVEKGSDVADKRIVELMGPGDLVVTADIPLAAAVVEKGGTGLDPRGEVYSEENIGQILAFRNLMHDLREEGMVGGGPPPLSKNARLEFANALDRWLARARADD